MRRENADAGFRMGLAQLVLADKFDPYKLVYEGCLVCNPGSFARSSFGWLTYDPYLEKASQRMEER